MKGSPQGSPFSQAKVDKKQKTIFTCSECGKTSPKWLGRCPDCQSWNTFQEVRATSTRKTSSITAASVIELSQVDAQEKPRLCFGLNELDRVLGGGIVPGSLVLVSGDPGIGKSTLLLQASAAICRAGQRVAYVSGEESSYQTRLRADRLAIRGDGLFLLTETNMEAIIQSLDMVSPSLAIIDSIQTVYLPELGAPGSVSQVRECTLRLMQWAKASSVPLLIAGHVTKEGMIAGPKVLEHIVDVVLQMEGESLSTYRLLRSIKNRFGSTNEIGIFEMRGSGLVEVENPSQVFLSRRSEPAPGTVVTPTLEGTRPLLVEVQALATPTSFGLPRRTSNGIDQNRLLLIIAVLSKRSGLGLGNQDVLVNLVGGLRVSEPAMDLAVATSLASSVLDRSIDQNMVVVGEVGLNGEVRGVSQMERRLAEAARQGFGMCIAPAASLKDVRVPDGIRAAGVNTLREALRLALPRKERPKQREESDSA